jgi:hypothetical protein
MGIVATLTIARTWYDYGNGEPPGQSAVRRQLVAFRIPVTYPRFGGLFIPANSRGPFTDLRHRSEDIETSCLTWRLNKPENDDLSHPSPPLRMVTTIRKSKPG